MARPPWPGRCAALDNSRPWSSVSARRRTRSSTVSSVWPPRGRWALKTLSARLLEADERAAKAAIHGLNDVGRRPNEWEEAWIVHALVREDGMTQVEVAELLGRHKSWVCRRLALVEQLADEAREDLRLGLLSATAARSLVRLPAGNQADVLATLHRDESDGRRTRRRGRPVPGRSGPDAAGVHPGPAAPGPQAISARGGPSLGPSTEPGRATAWRSV